MGQDAEDWTEALAVQLRLVVQVFEDEGQLGTLRHASDREVEPSAIAVLLVRSAVV